MHSIGWSPLVWRPGRDVRCAISPGPCPYASIGLPARVAERYQRPYSSSALRMQAAPCRNRARIPMTAFGQLGPFEQKPLQSAARHNVGRSGLARSPTCQARWLPSARRVNVHVGKAARSRRTPWSRPRTRQSTKRRGGARNPRGVSGAPRFRRHVAAARFCRPTEESFRGEWTELTFSSRVWTVTSAADAGGGQLPPSPISVQPPAASSPAADLPTMRRRAAGRDRAPPPSDRQPCPSTPGPRRAAPSSPSASRQA